MFMTVDLRWGLTLPTLRQYQWDLPIAFQSEIFEYQSRKLYEQLYLDIDLRWSQTKQWPKSDQTIDHHFIKWFISKINYFTWLFQRCCNETVVSNDHTSLPDLTICQISVDLTTDITIWELRKVLMNFQIPNFLGKVNDMLMFISC